MREQLQEALATKVATIGTVVKDAVVEALYQKELAVRTEATHKIVVAIDKLDEEIARIKPKSPGFGADKTALEPVYSTSDFDKLTKLNKQREALDGALNDALANGNFDKLLKEAANAGKSEGGSSNKGE